MGNQEVEYDKLLHIKTCGRDDTDSDLVNFPYEPTPYIILERLASSGYFRKKNTLLDYGCGRGRVDFFLSYQTGCKSVGVEYNERIYLKATNNLDTGLSKNKVSFVNQNASDYIVNSNIDRCYYFNPFCVDVLKDTISRIKDSYNQSQREILLFFYYPSINYIEYLDSVSFLTKIEEIDCTDLYNELDSKEKILIYKIQ